MEPTYKDGSYNKSIFEVYYDSVEGINEEEDIYLIYERTLNSINKILDDALAINGTSLTIFKEYLFNINRVAKSYPMDMLITINVFLSKKELKKENQDQLENIGKIINMKEESIIKNCIKDGYIKNYNSFIICILMRGLLEEILNLYIADPERDYTEKINKFLFDTILIHEDYKVN